MANTEKNEIYVTELAGPDDRWLSVTDAARITRRQEKSIRDWVESGKLPVHPERVGLNKRTRQVRLSDLAKLTPIVDPEAGISTDVGLLDLPSIPKAQQRLAEQMADLQGLVGTLQKAVEEQISILTDRLAEFVQEMRPAWAAISTLQEQFYWLQGRDNEQRQLIEQVREKLTERLDTQVRELVQVRESLVDQIAQVEQALRLVVSEQVGQSEVRLRQELVALSARLAEGEQALRKEQAEAVEHLTNNIRALGTHLVESLQGEHNRTSEALQARQVAHEQLQAQSNERHTETSRQLAQLAERATTFDGRLSSQETRTSQLESTWQQRAAAAEKEARQLRLDLDNQAKTQQALQKQLDEERKAREQLAKQVEKLLQQGQKKDKG